MSHKRKNQAKQLRFFRKVHRTTGVLLFVFFFIVAVTGFLLGIKKHSGGIILPESKNGTTKELSSFLPLDSLQKNAQQYIKNYLNNSNFNEIDRIDVRPEKGMVKFTFKSNFYEVQLDGATGNLLQIDLRRSDVIEKIHDGSIVDYYLGLESGVFKLIYTIVMSFALMLFTITGFWLWYGPKRMRKS
ncbi:MAG: PepSY domain-containing protein [Flavobacterium sp.]|uniref:PepSY domain-containing protein n=1 Tax=Flavobacterium sp. TaxID=239 RepID=UPI001DA9BA5D|nr:PepSY domain-containing protein [Flavobacterium sp.]